MILLDDEHKQIFTEQVNDHVEKLNGLMSLVAGESIEESEIEKAALATKLLEGSTRMLGIDDWSESLKQLRQLVRGSSRSGVCWNEQLSQVVSEFLEIEEQAVAEILTGSIETIDWGRKFAGVNQEIEVLLGSLSSEAKEGGLRPESPDSVYIEEPVDRVDDQSDGFTTLDKLIGSLYRVKDQFREYLEGQSKKESVVKDLELSFGECEFYIGLLGSILNRLGDSRQLFRAKVSSSTALEGVRDFFNLHGGVRGWNAELQTRSDDFSLEQEAASALATLLESCLFDVCRMYERKEDFSLEVTVDVKDVGSYLFAKVIDNGPNFLCDSKIDCDDTVAFYPGLLHVRSLLEERGGLLWVEPNKGKSARFQFTLPHSSVVTDYHITEFSGKELAVPCYAIERIIEIKNQVIVEENSARYIQTEMARIPVYYLNEMTAEEVTSESDGDRIVIVGLAEKRVGLIANGPGRRVQGVLDQCTEGCWASLTRHYLHLGEHEFPVLDIKLVLNSVSGLHGLESALDEPGSYAVGEEVGKRIEEIPVPRV